MDSGTILKKNITLISDFNISLLGRYLLAGPSKDELKVSETPFGQVVQSLTNFEANSIGNEVAFIWARAESISLNFQKALGMAEVSLEDCLEELDFFADLIVSFAKKQKFCFVASFVLPNDHPGYGILDWRPRVGLTHLVQSLNIRLAEKLESGPNIYLLDSDRWLKATQAPFTPKLWYAAKIPFANNVFQQAATDIVSALTALEGNSKRLILLDLDNTLWGGIVGEYGWKGIRLGGHDHVGEAFRAFQEALKSLTRRGIQLAIVSKNEEFVAFEAIDNHPDMVLTRKDFAAWRINWEDKAQNIVDLLEEIKLGALSAVFIDDNPVERDRIKSALPDLLVPDWPEDPCMYVHALYKLKIFDTPTISHEDRQRTEMYTSDRARREIKSSSFDSWLDQLQTSVLVEPVNKTNIARVEQLFNKTNQMNLSTRRLSSNEILEWLEVDNRRLLTCSVSDKFGCLGLTGIVGIELNGDKATVSDYILSCRVMGRRVEELMIYLAVKFAQKINANQLYFHYSPTERNTPTLKFLRQSGLVESNDHRFYWDCKHDYPKPNGIEFTQNGDVF